MKTWIEVSESRLTANYNALTRATNRDPAPINQSETAPNTTVLAVVKANAYGHGAAVCAPILARAAAPWLGVTDVAEGALVRAALTAAGIDLARQPQILIMCGLLQQDAPAVIHHRLTPVLWEPRHIDWLTTAFLQQDHQPDGPPAAVPVHLEIDTGMTRQGIPPGPALNALLRLLKSQDKLHLDGVMTHFASSEVAGSAQTLTQRKLFEQSVTAVSAASLRPTWLHAGNTSTVDNQGLEQNLPWLRALAVPIGATPMVRTGLGLYGYSLPIENASTTPIHDVQPQLRPVMSWKTRILDLRTARPGDTIGYNATFSSSRPMQIALLPIGYADGLRRELSASNTHPGGWVIIAGHRAPIVGRISMNLTTVDVTAIPNLSPGDEVTILGDGITANDHARLARTISYEILCGIRAQSHPVA